MFENPAAPEGAAAVVTFWKEAGRERWFAKEPEFDRRPILGRSMRPVEQRVPDEGGFVG